MVDGEKLSFIEDGDLYCLFGNLTDNALEAVSKIPNEEKRIINKYQAQSSDFFHDKGSVPFLFLISFNIIILELLIKLW